MIRLSAPLIAAAFLSIMVVSCAPVLDRGIMGEGSREVSFAALREHPGQFQGKIFIMGGVIVGTEFSGTGLQIEAVHVPVGRLGEFEDSGRSEGRFLMVLTKNEKVPDRTIYVRGHRITLAGEFIGTKPGKIDELEYVYPLFRIRQVYLWPSVPYSSRAYLYDPWFYPYPYTYGHPWWYDPLRSGPVPVQPQVPPGPPAPPGSEKEHEGEQERK